MNTEPAPGAVSTRALPPWAAARAATIDSPSPVPFPGAGLAAAVEAVEDMRGLLGVEAGTLVGHPHEGDSIRHASPSTWTGRGRGRVHHRVLQEVVDDLAQARRVAIDHDGLTQRRR